MRNRFTCLLTVVYPLENLNSWIITCSFWVGFNFILVDFFFLGLFHITLSPPHPTSPHPRLSQITYMICVLFILWLVFIFSTVDKIFLCKKFYVFCVLVAKFNTIDYLGPLEIPYQFRKHCWDFTKNFIESIDYFVKDIDWRWTLYYFNSVKSYSLWTWNIILIFCFMFRDQLLET